MVWIASLLSFESSVLLRTGLILVKLLFARLNWLFWHALSIVLSMVLFVYICQSVPRNSVLPVSSNKIGVWLCFIKKSKNGNEMDLYNSMNLIFKVKKLILLQPLPHFQHKSNWNGEWSSSKAILTIIGFWWVELFYIINISANIKPNFSDQIIFMSTVISGENTLTKINISWFFLLFSIIFKQGIYFTVHSLRSIQTIFQWD